MKTQLWHRLIAIALLAPAAPALMPTAFAAPPLAIRSQGPQLFSLQMASTAGLRPGALLTFTLQGTPNAQGRVRIAGTDVAAALNETFPGVYTGYYTLRQSDRIEGNSPIQATLRAGRETVAGNYQFPAQPDARFARIDLPRWGVTADRAGTAILGAPPR